ncbi:uncharacterized protein LOC135627390 isoform X1 [Musa acuminata AAA Group]|uniref:uncharacterized protein LOC135627390 isoform X1 n=1 Tax=Musa acuminata AAA Group TaxID=214697 RepID=UPI0031D9CE72
MRAECHGAPIRRTSLSACRSLLRTLFRNSSFGIICSAIISPVRWKRRELDLLVLLASYASCRRWIWLVRTLGSGSLFRRHMGSSVNDLLFCYIISMGLLLKHQNLQLDKLNSLAVVVDSEEAKNTTKIKQLLCWLSSIGIKYVILYDMQGVLKQTIGTDLESLTNTSMTTCSVVDAKMATSLFHFDKMAIEIISLSDGKEGVAKAASFLYSEHMKDDSEICYRSEPDFTESDVANALKATGSAGAEPDLLLVYGPARCHLGFPAWRLRYTEIVHMGRLRSMKFAAIVKTMHDFSKKHQNYGK